MTAVSDSQAPTVDSTVHEVPRISSLPRRPSQSAAPSDAAPPPRMPSPSSGGLVRNLSTLSSGDLGSLRRTESNVSRHNELHRTVSTFGSTPRFERDEVAENASKHEALSPKKVEGYRPQSSNLSRARRASGGLFAPEGVTSETPAAPGPGAYTNAAPVLKRMPSARFGSAERSLEVVPGSGGLAAVVVGRSSSPMVARSSSPISSRPVPKEALVKHQPSATFSTAPRFPSPTTCTPGPGAYAAAATSSRTTSPARAPLSRSSSMRSSSAPRSPSPTKRSSSPSLSRSGAAAAAEPTPGPGSYTLPSAFGGKNSKGGIIGSAPREVSRPLLSSKDPQAGAAGASLQRTNSSSSSAALAASNSSFTRTSSNVFLRASQERTERVQNPHTGGALLRRPSLHGLQREGSGNAVTMWSRSNEGSPVVSPNKDGGAAAGGTSLPPMPPLEEAVSDVGEQGATSTTSTGTK